MDLSDAIGPQLDYYISRCRQLEIEIEETKRRMETYLENNNIQQLIQEATDLLNSGENMADIEQYIKDVFDNTTKE